jgi:hypothetical protein
MKKLFCCKTAFALILAILIGFASASAEAWKFGVMSDTQWIGTDDGKNPNTVAVDIIKQLNQQFIGQGVKFVIQVGDLVDSYSTDSMATTAVFRQDLYNFRHRLLPAPWQPRERSGGGEPVCFRVPSDSVGW